MQPQIPQDEAFASFRAVSFLDLALPNDMSRLLNGEF